MEKTLLEIAKFTGRACGTIARDLADLSRPATEAFGRGWEQGWGREAKPAQGAPSAAEPA